MHATVRRESVAGYATDETLVCGPKEHTRWWQRYRGHLQGLLYRLIFEQLLIGGASLASGVALGWLLTLGAVATAIRHWALGRSW